MQNSHFVVEAAAECMCNSEREREETREWRKGKKAGDEEAKLL